MAEREAEGVFDRASATIDDAGWSGLLKYGFGTIFLGAVFAVTDLFGGILDSIFAPVRALFEGIARFITGTVGGGVTVIDAGATSSARSLLEGIGAFAGPYALPLAVSSVVLSLMIINWWWNRADFDPWGLFQRRRS